MRQSSILLLCFILFTGFTAWGQHQVTGTVTDESSTPLIGVTVFEEGTTNGALTDTEGKFILETASSTANLIVAYSGYQQQTVALDGRNTIDVVMVEGIALDEVVITALGITREAKSLTYAAQNVSTEELSQARELNVVNSLSGKVAGISISPNGSGVGADSRVILRGNRSIFGSSRPLFIVDGVPILGDITDINPDDIASISVLKGPNAAALYGNRANNGAIIISTKTGGAGGFKIGLNTTVTASTPIILTNYQDQFGQGNAGQYNGASEDSWGPAISGQVVDHWSPDPNFPESTYALQAQSDNVNDFFQTGLNVATNLTISGGTDKAQTYFSYTFTDAEGIVPNNELQRHNVNVRVTNKLMKKLTLDAKLTYIREDVDNQLPTGESFANPVRHALRLPRTIRTSDVEIFEYLTDEGAVRQHYWNPGSNGGANPYWTINRNTNQRDLDRVIAFVSLRYEILEGLSIMARSALDRINRQGEDRLANDSYVIADNGRFSVTLSEQYEWNNDVLVSYDKQLTDDWFISVNGGANSRMERGTSLNGNVPGGIGLIVPNFFSLINNTNDNIASYNFGAPRDVNSVYGFAQVAFKDAVFLDITARNDWSSTLPEANRSFFYPSFGLNVVLSDLITVPSWITFAKFRGSWPKWGMTQILSRPCVQLLYLRVETMDS